ncbi:methyltransferase family protein [Motilibacter peucedani]|uniref:Methyltransferase family protein n=1 Tax=Motilibacter peucedani TaxID=598650 RepID=A0A420XNA0_9ACTN|nr:class I SAM-dependent methyltransferase [Motilibacter peucedani]RKS72752.1 methyltransferase family protein [Motilibacter peucedani]
MGFDVPADAYAQFMGRWSESLAVRLADRLELRRGMRALDVGCGPGALTAVLVDRLGADAVSAVEPSASFVEAARARLPEVDVRHAAAEDLPFDTSSFDRAAAQLVVHFMADPVQGLREMARVVRPGGLVAASVWDYASGTSPLSTFWTTVARLDPATTDESGSAGAREGELAELMTSAGLSDIESLRLEVTSRFASLDEWWRPYTYGVWPAGEYVARLDERRRAELRDVCAALLPDPPFELSAGAWAALGRVTQPA